MSTPKWESGKLYLTGALVQPAQAIAPVSAAITNPGFESGSTDWTLDAGVTVVAGGFSGQCAQFTTSSGVLRATHISVNVAPGTSITGACMYGQGAASSGQNTGAVFLRWLTSADALIREDAGTLITSSSGGGWKQSIVTGVAPATAAKVQIGCLSNRSASNASFADSFTWNYVTQSLPAGLIYKAVQPAAGTSGSTEPVWPLTLGLQVVDNEVIWEAVSTSRVVWEASPILQSGATEPVWPTEPGEFVSDGTIKWECISRRVEDVNCPNTKVVAIISSKVYAVDRDIVRFSATANPLDWTTADDAGFLPTGLQQANANDMAVLAPYRANLTAFNASSFQNWQVDPDPAAMAILDQMDGVGSTWPKAAQPVSNELFYLAALGVRTVGIAAGSENLAAGDVGMPIDELVQAAVKQAVAQGAGVLATYYPSAGQYWLTFSEYPTELALSGDVPNSQVGASVATSYTASGGSMPYSYAITSGALPTGYSLNTVTGAVTGTATLAGVYTWTVTATDALNDQISLPDTATIAPMTITGDLPSGIVGDVVSYQYTVAYGVLPRVVTLQSGSLPTGLSISTSGLVTGTLTTRGTFNWTVRVTDDAGNTADVADTAQVCEQVMGSTVTASLALTGDDRAASIAYQDGTVAYYVEGAYGIAVAGTLGFGDIDASLTQSATGTHTVASGSPGDDRLWAFGGDPNGWTFGPDLNFNYAELWDSGTFQARVKPTSGDGDDWFGAIGGGHDGMYGNGAWMDGTDAYIGVRFRGGINWKRIYKWPLAASGSVVTATAISPELVAGATAIFWMHIDRTGRLWVLNDDAELLELSKTDLSILSTTALTGLDPTDLCAFAIDAGKLFMWYGAAIKELRCYRISTLALISTATITGTIYQFNDKLLCTDDSIYLQSGKNIKRIDYAQVCTP